MAVSGLVILLILIIIAIISLIVVYFVFRKKGNYSDTHKQVFHIAENIFSYDEARAVCKANNSQLATLEQMIDAYEKGADWCNYGWSENQLALYPTQIESWTKNQSTYKKNACGKVGVNGGYFKNKTNLFGANCFGIKPHKSHKNVDSPPYQAMSDIDMQAALYSDKHYKIAPFNSSKWSEYD